MSNPWPPAPARSDAPLRATLDHMAATVAVASGMAAAGRTLDLAGLDSTAGALCAQILDLPPAEGLGFRAALLELDGKLAALATAIRGPA